MTRASFLSISDPRGDIDFVSAAVDIATRRDVQANAIFVIGNIVGSIITPEERPVYFEARKILELELNSKRAQYDQDGVRDITSLGHIMTANPDHYRRGEEIQALRTIRVYVGLKDRSGRLLERGRAALRARKVYEQLEEVFKRSKVPVYVLGDTILAEDSLPPARHLHFARLTVAGIPIRALPVEDYDDPDFLPELRLGARRDGKAVNLDDYPISEGRVIFTPHLNPMVHEVLKSHAGQLVVTCGDGSIDCSYPNSILASQTRGHAYVYRIDGPAMTRGTLRMVKGGFGEATADDVVQARATMKGDVAQDRRRDLEARARLAGFGQELIKFTRLMRKQNPALAAEIENSSDRVEVVLKYVHEIESQLKHLQDVLSVERAGMSRVIRTLEPIVGPAHAARIYAAFNLPPEKQFDVEAVDAANVEAARLIAEALSLLKSGPPTPPKGVASLDPRTSSAS
jgi:hypothetical protein